jgi:TolB-like protein
MTSWRSSSASSGLGRAAAVALALAGLAGCRHVPPPPAAPQLLALFPVQNASGGQAPIRALTEALEAELTKRGVALVPRRDLDEVLARHRLRYLGGVDRPTATALREELGVDGVLIPTLEQYSAAATPRVALSVRVTETSDRPVVLWADAVARSGDDAPGLLGVGIVTSVADLERTVVDSLARSVQGYVTARTRGASCGGPADRFRPRRRFRAPALDDLGRRTVAVLPFGNQSGRRGAGDVVVGQFIAQLARSGAFEVLDPGVVREQVLAHRMVLEGGVSIDRAMALLDVLGADLVVSGDVHDYVASPSPRAPPSAEFTAYAIDQETAELVWSSTSTAGGEDGVFFFGAGRIETSSALSCRMVAGVVDGMVGHRLQAAVVTGTPTSQELRLRNSATQFQRQGRDSTSGNYYGNMRESRARGMNQRDSSPDERPTTQNEPP